MPYHIVVAQSMPSNPIQTGHVVIMHWLTRRDRAVNESWSPSSIPEEVSSVPGFPGEETFDAAVFLADCAALQGRVDRDIQQHCPFLLQVCDT